MSPPLCAWSVARATGRLMVGRWQCGTHGPYVAFSFLSPSSLLPAWLLYPHVTLCHFVNTTRDLPSWGPACLCDTVTSVVFACVPALCRGWREAVWRCQWCWAGGADPSTAITRSSLCTEQMPPAQKAKRSWLGPLLSLPNPLGNHLAELGIALGGHYWKCCSKSLWDYKILFTCPTEKSEHLLNICSSQGDKTWNWTALNHFELFKERYKEKDGPVFTAEWGTVAADSMVRWTTKIVNFIKFMIPLLTFSCYIGCIVVMFQCRQTKSFSM